MGRIPGFLEGSSANTFECLCRHDVVVKVVFADWSNHEFEGDGLRLQAEACVYCTLEKASWLLQAHAETYDRIHEDMAWGQNQEDNHPSLREVHEDTAQQTHHTHMCNGRAQQTHHTHMHAMHTHMSLCACVCVCSSYIRSHTQRARAANLLRHLTTGGPQVLPALFAQLLRCMCQAAGLPCGFQLCHHLLDAHRTCDLSL